MLSVDRLLESLAHVYGVDVEDLQCATGSYNLQQLRENAGRKWYRNYLSMVGGFELDLTITVLDIDCMPIELSLDYETDEGTKWRTVKLFQETAPYLPFRKSKVWSHVLSNLC